MKSISRGKRILVIFIVVILFFTGISVITDTPPVVFISGKPHFVFSSEIKMNQNEREFSNKDVKALKHMKWVTNIRMLGTEITDISFLNEMSEVKDITLVCANEYPIPDLTPLSNCKELESFLGYIPNITDLSAFKELKKLSFLQINITNSKINDISDVKYLTKLWYLEVGGENIKDISSLKYCTKLDHLGLTGTTADADYSVLFELSELNLLFIDKGVLTKEEIKILEEKGVSVHEREVEEEE